MFVFILKSWVLLIPLAFIIIATGAVKITAMLKMLPIQLVLAPAAVFMWYAVGKVKPQTEHLQGNV